MKSLTKKLIITALILTTTLGLCLGFAIPKKTQVAQAAGSSLFSVTASKSEFLDKGQDDTLTLTISINNPNGYNVYGFEGHIVYDLDVFTFQSWNVDYSAWSTESTCNMGKSNPSDTRESLIVVMNGAPITATGTTKLATITLKINGRATKNHTANYYNFGLNNFSIVNQMGDELEYQTSMPTITFTAPSNNATLSTSQPISVAVSGGTPQTLQVSSGSTSGNTTSFTLQNALPYSATKTGLNITATKADAKASMQITGASANEIKNGSRKATITVTAEDGTTKHNYEISFSLSEPSSDSALKGNVVLTKKAGSTSSGSVTIPVGDFTQSGSTYSYTISEEFAYNITSVEVVVTTNNTNATKSVSGTSLNPGATNQINIVVTAEDGQTKTTYQISVKRAAPVTNKGVKVEIINAQNATTDITSVSTHSIDLGLTPFKIVVTPNVQSTTATIQIADEAYTSGSSYSVDKTGDIKVKIVVRSEDGATETIEKTIVVINTNADTSIKSVRISQNSQELQVRFLQGVYRVQLASWETKPLYIDIEASDPTAEITIVALSDNSDSAYLSVCDNKQFLPISAQVTRLRIFIKLQDGTEKVHDVQLIWPLEENNSYVSFGGDLDLSISEQEFNDPGIFTPEAIKIKANKFDFYINIPDGFEVVVLYGKEVIDGNASVVSGQYQDDVASIMAGTESAASTAKHFHVEGLKAGNNAVVIKITNNETGVEKICVLNIERPVAKSTALIVVVVVLSVILVGIIALLAVFYTKKTKKGNKKDDNKEPVVSEHAQVAQGETALGAQSVRRTTTTTTRRAPAKKVAEPTTITIKTR